MSAMLAAAVAGGVGALAVARGAMADDGCQGMSCPQPVGPTPDAKAVRLGEWKMDLAERWYEKKMAGEPLGDLADDLKAWAEAAGIPGEFDDLTRDSLAVPRREVTADSSAGSADAVPSSGSPKQEDKVLSMATQAQENGYYCGPATALMVNNYLCAHKYDSQCDSRAESPGLKLTQQHLASQDYLATDPGGTGFGDNWRLALNGWWDYNRSLEGWYYIHWSPDNTEYVMRLVFDIDRLYPFAADTHQVPGGQRLVAWPPPPPEGYSHYVVGAGYWYYGGETSYIDPYDGFHGPDSFGYHHHYMSTTMVELLQYRGAVW